jgi:hypothetical protein
MQLIEATVKAKEQLQALLNRDVPNVTSASKVEDGWQLTLELIERKAIPDSQDLLGMYEVILNEDGDLTSYERIRVRKRMDLEEVVE